jgi:hypothetical protein
VGRCARDEAGGVRRALALLGLALLAGLAVLVVGLLVWGRGGPDESFEVPVPVDPAPAIQANTSLLPRTVAFGDTVTARVDVTLDRRRIDADSVRVATDFAPWTQIADPERVRRDGETTTHLRTMWTLRCLASACLPPAQSLRLPLTPVTVSYDTLGPNAASGRQLTEDWPLLVVNTRLEDPGGIPSASATSPFETPWRADMVAMPPVSYRVEPETARIPLFAAAGAFALLGLWLAYLGRPRPRPKPVPVVEEAPPAPVLTPVEQALALLEDAMAANGAADRRRALELVAGELSGTGNDDLARLARSLAWSKPMPEVDRTTPLAEEARPALGLDAEPDVAEEQLETTEPEEARPGA